MRRRTVPTLLLLAALLACGALAQDAPRPPTPYERAVEAYRDGEIERAAALLQAALDAGEAGAGERALLGWCRLRQGDVDAAAAAFAAAREAAPAAAEPQAGLGYVALRRGDPRAARARFLEATSRDGGYGEAWKGLGLAQTQLGERKAARASFRRAVETAPDDAEARRLLDENLASIVEESRPRPSLEAQRPLRVPVRAQRSRIEVLGEDGFEPLFVKGINLGTALPGRFPAEFPDDPRLYRAWFDLMSDAGFNAVRLYTLHPPSLYDALDAHNRERPERKLWLIQGAWTELPPDDDFDAPEFDEAFRDEIRRVIDALHGNLDLPPRPGHAHGRYRSDLSDDLLALALGREWEPFAVDAYNRTHAAAPPFQGRWVRSDPVYPIESWLASICDTAIEHATTWYGTQVPVGFTSWPTLDPLLHPTEATVEEEMRFRKARGETLHEEIKEYDNDLVQIDTTRMHATPAFEAGLFAVYHAYPYYPEFMMLDPGYAEADDGEGVSRYLGYLRALAEHHGDQPVLILEFGVPTSRGIAHLHPEGQHHGGHDSSAQGRIDARLMRNIAQAGLAGGAVFAWIDEWFKRNWLVMNYESPPQRNRLWLNALDAEQNYGLIGAYPGRDGWAVVLDGRDDDWQAKPPFYRGDGPLRSMRVASDAAYLYLALELRGGDREVLVGVDTYDTRRGSHRFPPPVDRESAVGLEFLLRFAGRERAEILVDRSYDLFSNRLRRPYRSRDNDRGDFVEIVTYTNRDRYGRDGTYYPPKGYSRSPLRFGSTDPASPRFDDLADWYVSPDGRFLEARIPWGLLNVADPSSLRVIHETDRTEGVVQTAVTDGFRFHVLALGRNGRVVDAFPERDRLDAYPSYRWDGWDAPEYRLEPKPSYRILKKALAEIPSQN